MRKKRSNDKIEQKEKKSRAKYKCPDDVRDLIILVNIVPFPQNMMHLNSEIEYRTRLLRQQTGDDGASVRIRDVLIEALEDLPEEFHNYLKGFCRVSWLRPIDISEMGWRDIDKIYSAYLEFFRLHQETIYYATRLKSDRDGTSYPNNWEIFTATASGKILRDDKGNNYLDGLAGVIHKIIPDRFRMCEVCNKIFWAENKNSFTCSEPCRNALRQLRYRKKNKEDVNAKRRERYQLEKQKKELEKKERRKALLDKYK